MKTDRFLIGYTDDNSGLQTNVKPWLLPDNAFQLLENCYVYRGSVRKKLGSTWSGTGQLGSRLRYALPSTDSSGDATGTAPGAIFTAGQMFSIGSTIFTVNTPGTPATLLSTTGGQSMTFDTVTGDYTVSSASPSTVIYFYPATPVMGINQFIVPGAFQNTTIAFDTQFSYQFDATTNSWLALTAGDAVWTGTDENFFWSINYEGSTDNLTYLWVTNFKEADGIRYFDGTTWTTASLTYNNGGDEILTCLLIIEFQNRLLLLNTVESVSSTPTNFYNRVRYSWLGSPLDSNAFNEDFGDAANSYFIDAPTQESIVTAQFLKNRLIVYFTESTYELAFTGSQVNPFIFQKINTELGAESPFSEIPFDKEVLGVDNIGIHGCNGANVDRIDEVIPQLSFGVSTQPGSKTRIIGIRDYYNEIAYWTYCDTNRSSGFYFPNKTLIYNYINGSWAITDDSYTFFGYFLTTNKTEGATWGSTTTEWEELTRQWNATSDTQNSPNVRIVIGGNQQGFMMLLRSNVSSECPSLQISDVTATDLGTMTVTSINNNLSLDSFVLFSDMNGLTFTDSNGNVLNRAMGRVSSDPLLANTPNSFTVTLLDNDLNPVTVTGTYLGGGLAQRVTNINILTKQYNFYTNADRNIYISKVDFLVDATTNGRLTVDFLVSSSYNSLLSGSTTNGSLLGTNTLETSPYALIPFEQYQSRLWHPLYFYAEGECVQLSFFMSPDQMYYYDISSGGNPVYSALQDFQLNAMVIYAQPTSNRMQ